jgi:large-conductance mechanosensitive channel
MSIHADEQYTTRFGWLASRYRRSRWWFFVVWLFYEFIRAGFLAGASTQPLIQVFGLLVVEIVAFASFVILRPFEGQRLNVMVMYLLGFSKVATTALSAAFDTRFGVARISTTVIGIVIIVIHGFLTIAVMIFILIGVVSSYMSIMRNQEETNSSCLTPTREKYFAHMDFAEQDTPRPRAVSVHSAPEVPKTPYFKVKQVRRMAKLEDEDDEFMREINAGSASEHLLPQQDCSYNAARPDQGNRTRSLHSQASYSSLPRAARQHRPSWSRQDYSGPMGLGRQRALSDVQTPTRKESNKTIDIHQSPLGTYQSRPDTPTLSSA